ncbi:MAG: hypothetical protein WBM08_00725 [Prochlorococcaceae cyanobacterium]
MIATTNVHWDASMAIGTAITDLARQAFAQPKGLAPSGGLQASRNRFPLLPLPPEWTPWIWSW